MASTAKRPRWTFIVESGADVRLVNGLAEYGELTVFARRIDGGVEISRDPAPGISVEVGPSGRLAFALMVLIWVWRHRRERAILVQGYGLAALAANIAGRLTGVPVTMLVCSPVEAYYRCRLTNPEPGKPYRELELRGLAALAWINARVGGQYVVLSAHLEDVVRSHGTTKPVHRIPVYGVDLDVFSPSDVPRRLLRERLGLPLDGALAFFSSRVAPEKDTRTLLKAMKLLAAQGRDVRVLHRSGGYLRFLELANEYGVADRVVATDALHPAMDLASSYRACDMCVQASLEEGLGFSVLEAMACGTPAVAANVGGLKETVIEGRTGWQYPATDPDALMQAIIRVCDEPGEAARRADNATAVVRQFFERRSVFLRLVEHLGFVPTNSEGTGMERT